MEEIQRDFASKRNFCQWDAYSGPGGPASATNSAGSGLDVVLAVWFGAVLLVAACWYFNRPPILRQWFLTDFRPWLLDQWAELGIVGFGFSAVAAFYLMLAVHELGHVAAGLCVGFRLRSLRIGPLLFSRPFRVSLYRGPGAVVNGVAELIPVATDKLAWRGVSMVLGGPGANFLSAIVVLLLPLPITAFSGFFIACSIANGVSDLFPFESRLGVSDGRRIWMLLRQPERGERWLALLHLGGQLSGRRAAGIAIRRLPRQSRRGAGRFGGHRDGVCHGLFGSLPSGQG